MYLIKKINKFYYQNYLQIFNLKNLNVGSLRLEFYQLLKKKNWQSYLLNQTRWFGIFFA